MPSEREYRYVGPTQLLELAGDGVAGRRVSSVRELEAWITDSEESSAQNGLTAATYVVDRQGQLLLAARGSEHVVCAGGHPVLAAGEMFFDGLDLVEVTNQSTGYCPVASPRRSCSAAAPAAENSTW
jgi:hypothetical protein